MITPGIIQLFLHYIFERRIIRHHVPIKRPVEQEVFGVLREVRFVSEGSETLVDHILQPGSPALQSLLLLQRSLEALLQLCYRCVTAAAHPGRLFLVQGRFQVCAREFVGMRATEMSLLRG